MPAQIRQNLGASAIEGTQEAAGIRAAFVNREQISRGGDGFGIPVECLERLVVPDQIT
jgi:hypothetical protein